MRVKKSMKTTASKALVVERVADLAMQLGGRHLADYGATTSRHDFTQRQLMACLILRAYLKTTYRGVLELLAVSPSLRRCLGLSEKLPHYSTLAKFSDRSKVLEIVDVMIQSIARAVGQREPNPAAAAMDATGLETTTASAHFQCQRGGQRRKWVKISTVVLCGSLLPLGLVLDWGPNNDKCQAAALITKAQQAAVPGKVPRPASRSLSRKRRTGTPSVAAPWRTSSGENAWTCIAGTAALQQFQMPLTLTVIAESQSTSGI